MKVRVALCTALALALFGASALAQARDAGIVVHRPTECRLGPADRGLHRIIETPQQSPRNRAVAYKNRGNAWDAKGHSDRAIDDYGEAIRLDPDYGIAYSNRGRVWMVMLELDRAIADFNEAIRINPKHANAYFNRGVAWSVKEDHDHAIADFSEAIRLDPKAVDAYVSRGIAWHLKKNTIAPSPTSTRQSGSI